MSKLTDDEVWRGLKDLSAREKVLAADLVAYASETERRRLYRDHGWRSLFEYCVGSLRWSEAAAFRRGRAAKIVLAYPAVLEMLYDGRQHLEGLVILHAFLEDGDFPALLLRAVGKTAKEIEFLVAERRRDPPLRESIRYVGIAAPPCPLETGPTLDLGPCAEEAASAVGTGNSPTAAVAAPAVPSAPSPPSVPPTSLTPPAVRLVRIAFTADESLDGLIQRARQLMRHKYPDGRLEGLFKDALKLLIEKKDWGLRAQAAARRRAARQAGRAARAQRSTRRSK